MKRRTLIKGLIKGMVGIGLPATMSGRLYAMRDTNAQKTGVSVSGVPDKDSQEACGITPREVEGPFYPTNRRQEHDIDLTKIEGRSSVASGQIIVISGDVMDEYCQPITGATVEIWQANTWGKYNHHRDKNNPSPSDPNFQGWGVMNTDESGRYQFKTIIPGSYPVNPIWTRPPHIHFKVFADKYVELITQLYFAGQSLNQHDQLLMRLSQADRERVTTQLSSKNVASTAPNNEGVLSGRFNIVLRRR